MVFELILKFFFNMLTSHDVILGIQTIDVATSKYATLSSFFPSIKNSGFVFSGGMFSLHLKKISILLPFSKFNKKIIEN